MASARDIYLTTEDEFEIRGTYFEPEDPKGKGVVFFHMLRKERSVWGRMGEKLAKRGFASVSVDLRGHGESDGSWQGFSEDDFRNMIYDAQAAKGFLRDVYSDIKVSYVGASIGANLAILDSCKSGDVEACVLLSPGLDFHGLKVEDVAEDFSVPFFMIASENDYYSWSSCEKLDKYFCTPKKKREFMRLEEAGHGTNIFEADPNVQEKVIQWLEENI